MSLDAITTDAAACIKAYLEAAHTLGAGGATGRTYAQADLAKALSIENADSYQGDLLGEVAALAASHRSAADWLHDLGAALGMPAPDRGNRSLTLAAAKALAEKAAGEPKAKRSRAPKERTTGMPDEPCPILPPVGTKASIAYKGSPTSEARRTKGQVLEHTKSGKAGGVRTHDVSLPSEYLLGWEPDGPGPEAYIQRPDGSTQSGAILAVTWSDDRWVLSFKAEGQEHLAALTGPHASKWSLEPLLVDAIRKAGVGKAAPVEPCPILPAPEMSVVLGLLVEGGLERFPGRVSPGVTPDLLDLSGFGAFALGDVLEWTRDTEEPCRNFIRVQRGDGIITGPEHQVWGVFRVLHDSDQWWADCHELGKSAPLTRLALTGPNAVEWEEVDMCVPKAEEAAASGDDDEWGDF